MNAANRRFLGRVAPVLVLLLGVLATSCRNDEPDYPTVIEETCLMTYLRDTSGGVLLEMQRSESSEPVRMKAAVRFASHIEEGRRLLISYTANLADTALRPVPIEIVDARMVIWGTITPKPLEEILAMNPGEVEVVSRWQTRGHLNLQVLLGTDGTSRSFEIYADEATLDSGRPDCYIVNGGDEVEPLVERRAIASFSTSQLPANTSDINLLVHSKKND